MQDQTDLSRSWSSHHDTELEPEPNTLPLHIIVVIYNLFELNTFM